MTPQAKIITQLLNNIRDAADSNPTRLLIRENCNEAADCIIEILKFDAVKSNANLRKSIIQFTQRLCRNKLDGDHFVWDSSSLSILLKNTLLCDLNNEENSKKSLTKKKALSQLCLDFPIFDFQSRQIGFVEYSKDFMYALTNLNTKQSIEIIERVISLDPINNGDSEMYNFCTWLWKSGLDILSDSAYETLTRKVIPCIEVLFLELSTFILSEEKPCFGDIFQMNEFKFFNTFFSKCVASDICFYYCTHILNEIFFESNFDSCIQSLITYVFNEIRSFSTHPITCLYPKKLQSIVFYLQFDPECLLNNFRTRDIEENILVSLRSLEEMNKKCFVMVMSHHKVWLDHYANKVVN